MNEVKTSRAGRFLPLVIAVLALAVVACVCTGSGTTTETPVPSTTGGTTTGGTTTGGATQPTNVPAPTTAPSTTGGTTTGGTTTGGTTDGGTTDGSTGDQTDLEIINNTGGSICYVYIASSTDNTDWGDEVLGTDVIIGAGETDIVSGPPGVYDIIFEDCDHNVVAWRYGTDLTADTTLTVSGSADTLVVENGSTFDLCGIYISTPDQSNWGRSHLNPAHPIYAGETRSFAVTGGVWDLKAVTCDGQEIERLGQDLGGTFTWEFFNE